MGRYFAAFFERNGYAVIVSDRDTKLGNKALAARADVVIVSVPIDKTAAVIKEVAPRVKKTGLLMDLTSLKAGPMEAMKSTRASYLGCHPLFGPGNPIEGQVVALCPGRGQKWFDWWSGLLKANKVRVKTLTAKKHDELMAYVQVLSHFNDITLAETLRRSKIDLSDFLTYQSPSYRLKLDLMGRILNQDPNLYGNIQVGNPLSQKVIGSYLESCRELAELYGKKDLKSFENYFRRAARYLGDYKAQAMEASDSWIKAVIGSHNIHTSPPPKGNEDTAVLGPRNTYSDIALRSARPCANAYFASSIGEVFEMVADGRVKEGLVPLENSLTGSVRETLDELYKKDVQITEVVSQSIHLCLAAAKKWPLQKIEVIYSHPQALLQCRQFLKTACPRAVAVPLTSTVAALDRVRQEQTAPVAAIAAALAAKAAGLALLRDRIEDGKNNVTCFAFIAKKASRPSAGAKKTAIAFSFGKDAPGTLQQVLKDFSDRGINLTKIESRPDPDAPGEYVFYLDFIGRPEGAPIQKTLAAIRRKTARLKILGTY